MAATSRGFSSSHLLRAAAHGRSRWPAWCSVVLCGAIASVGMGGCGDAHTSDAASSDLGAGLGLGNGVLASFQSVDTLLSDASVVAGATVTVKCVGQPGEVNIPHPVYTTTPVKGVTVDGAQLTPTLIGTYAVQCTLPDRQPSKLDKAATLVVAPAATTSLVTTLSPDTIAAGGVSTATCAGRDAFGNDIGQDGKVWSLSLTPPEAGEIVDLTVTGHVSGVATVQCALEGAADAASPGASLTITPGAPVKTSATVTPDTFEVGAGSAKVTCAAIDAFGNAVDASTATLTYDSALTAGADGLTTTKSGKYEIFCALGDVAKEDMTAAVLVVTPGAPLSMTLTPKPNKPFYVVDDVIKLYGLGKDKYGNDVPDMVLVEPSSVDPPEGVTVNAGGKSYAFNTDGHYHFTGTSKDYPNLTASIDLTCDSVGPAVIITEPARGATLDGNTTVTVKGTVIDATSAFKSFVINKQTIQVGKDGAFTFDIQSVQGMNPIIWEAADEWDNKTAGVQTYYFSTKWYLSDFNSPKNSEIKDGIGLWMSQSVLDHPPHDHKKPHDFATVIEMVLGSLDLGSLIGPNGFPLSLPIGAVTLTGNIYIKNVKLGDPAKNDGFPAVTLTVLNGGVGLDAKIYGFSADVEVDMSAFGLPPLKTTIQITADQIDIGTDIYLTKDPTTGKLVSSAKNTSIKFVNLAVLPTGPLSTIFNPILKTIEQFVLGPLLNLLTAALAPQLNSMIGGGLGSVFGALAINTTIPMAPLIGKGPSANLKLVSDIGALSFQAKQGIVFGLDASMTGEHKVQHEIKGSIGRAGCMAEKPKPELFNPTEKYGIEIGIADDFVNQLLHAVWNAGLLQLTLDASVLGSVDLSKYGVSDLTVETDFWLPPILNTCIAADGGLKIQLGDMGVHAQLMFSGTPIDMHAFVTLQLGTKIKAVPDPKDPTAKAIGIDPLTLDVMEMQVVSINAEAKDFKDIFTSLIKGMLPSLLGGLTSTLGAIALPPIDLSAISPMIPAGTVLQVVIQDVANVTGYTYLRASIQ